DVRQFWDVNGYVSAYASLDEVPSGYWPVLVDDRFSPALQGLHLDARGQPFALVSSAACWSLKLSHLALEMLIDPGGNRGYAGEAPLDDQGPVEFLLAACDPCAGTDCAYEVDGVIVSDFITPAYAGRDVTGVRYSFTGAIAAPRQVRPGGCLSWLDPVSRQVWQQN